VVRAIDPEQPVFEVRTMEAFFGDSQVTNSVVVVQSVGAMGLMGIALALTGLYGLVAYTVNTRTREIGIRMALGAARAAVLRMVLRQGMTLALAGVAVGVVFSAIASRLMKSVFLSEGGSNLAAYLIVVPAVVVVTLAAAYIPARRASRIDPVRVLRYE
jgi:ABC-type antimicrobial peptide transport system permease subunit